MGSDRLFKVVLTPLLLLLCSNALAAYDINEIALGASEKDIKQHFPYANCRPLEWPSRAADRRCDDSRATIAGVDASVTFYLKRDAVEAMAAYADDVRAHRFPSDEESYHLSGDVAEALGLYGAAPKSA